MHIESAVDRSVEALTRLFNRGFEHYVVPMSLSGDQVAEWMAVDAIDLTESVVVRVDDRDVALAFVARRGGVRRLASMGVIPEYRGRAIGRAVISHLQRGGGAIELEVITSNRPACALYERTGFVTVDRLTGHVSECPAGDATLSLEPITLVEAARRVASDGSEDPPWLLSAPNIARMRPPTTAVALGPATLVIKDPTASTVSVRAVSVPDTRRGEGHGRRVLAAAFARWPGRRWQVPAKVPSAWSGFFDALGFERLAVEQYRMRWTDRSV